MSIYRRKHRPVPVSFFAFQDIITALAGSMLIFVLSLAVAKYHFNGNDSNENMLDRKEYDILQNRLSLNKSLLLKEERKIADLRKEFDRSKHNEKVLAVNQRLEISGKRLEKIAGERSRMLQDMQQELALLKQRNQALAAKNPELAELIKQAFELEKRYADQYKKLLFADNMSKQNIVLSVSRNSWTIRLPGSKEIVQLGDSTRALPRLLEKLRKFNSASTRLIMGVRPSAGGFAEPLQRELKRAFPAMETVAEPLAHETLGGLTL